MKRISAPILVGILLALFNTSALGQERAYFIDSLELKKHCKGSSTETAFCRGYAAGIFDALSEGSAVSEHVAIVRQCSSKTLRLVDLQAAITAAIDDVGKIRVPANRLVVAAIKVQLCDIQVERSKRIALELGAKPSAGTQAAYTYTLMEICMSADLSKKDCYQLNSDSLPKLDFSRWK